MKEFFTGISINVAATVLIAIICWATYLTCNLNLVFNCNITILQWLGISVISTCLFRNPAKPKE
jgi:phosphatidylserine synthase